MDKSAPLVVNETSSNMEQEQKNPVDSVDNINFQRELYRQITIAIIVAGKLLRIK